MPNLQVAHTCRRQEVIKRMHGDRGSQERLRNDKGWGLAGRGQCDRRTKDDAACRLSWNQNSGLPVSQGSSF